MKNLKLNVSKKGINGKLYKHIICTRIITELVDHHGHQVTLVDKCRLYKEFLCQMKIQHITRRSLCRAKLGALGFPLTG